MDNHAEIMSKISDLASDFAALSATMKLLMWLVVGVVPLITGWMVYLTKRDMTRVKSETKQAERIAQDQRRFDALSQADAIMASRVDSMTILSAASVQRKECDHRHEVLERVIDKLVARLDHKRELIEDLTRRVIALDATIIGRFDGLTDILGQMQIEIRTKNGNGVK